MWEVKSYGQRRIRTMAFFHKSSWSSSIIQNLPILFIISSGRCINLIVHGTSKLIYHSCLLNSSGVFLKCSNYEFHFINNNLRSDIRAVMIEFIIKNDKFNFIQDLCSCDWIMEVLKLWFFDLQAYIRDLVFFMLAVLHLFLINILNSWIFLTILTNFGTFKVKFDFLEIQKILKSIFWNIFNSDLTIQIN